MTQHQHARKQREIATIRQSISRKPTAIGNGTDLTKHGRRVSPMELGRTERRDFVDDVIAEAISPREQTMRFPTIARSAVCGQSKRDQMPGAKNSLPMIDTAIRA